jgi:hypothetical protein
VSTGGTFDTAAELIQRYGVMTAADFIPAEASVELSMAQEDALAAINTSLKSGMLSNPASRNNRALVRSELDKAWGLREDATKALDSVFGPDVAKRFDTGAGASGLVRDAKSIPIAVYDPTHGQVAHATLADAVGTGGPFDRTGPLAWSQSYYPDSPTDRRAFQKRFQRALADHVPVILVWYVDFHSLDDQGRFFAPPTSPGRQGGHMVVMEDYQIDDVPGFGTLAAGTLETRPAALTAALDDAAKLEFIRVKNSWGTQRSDRHFVIPGYHDLYMKYLDGPIQQCVTNADDEPDTSECWNITPFEGVVLPPEY